MEAGSIYACACGGFAHHFAQQFAVRGSGLFLFIAGPYLSISFWVDIWAVSHECLLQIMLSWVSINMAFRTHSHGEYQKGTEAWPSGSFRTDCSTVFQSHSASSYSHKRCMSPTCSKPSRTLNSVCSILALWWVRAQCSLHFPCDQWSWESLHIFGARCEGPVQVFGPFKNWVVLIIDL